MIISKTAKLRWNAKIKQHYVDCGYQFTKMKDEFEVDINDLTDGSSVPIEVKCDYCGKIFTKQWYRIIREYNNNVIQKDCCNDCKKYKIIETSQVKYGVDSVLSLQETKDKVAQTNIEKYGAANPFASKEVQEKIKETNLERYGVPSPLQNENILHKLRETCREKYGVDYYVETQRYYGIDNPRWKGGVAYHRNERATKDYIDWRNSVFVRDAYTCQCCGSRNGNGKAVILNAHHINNWKDYPKFRYDVDNGITLCEPCHMEFHSEYGKRNNTEMQLKSFIGNQGKKIC